MIEDSVLREANADFRPLLIEGDVQEIGSAVIRWNESRLTVRAVRGRKMRSLQGVFDEFSATFQFPLYFGENKDAFNECISELDRPARSDGYVILVTDPQLVLSGEDLSELNWLVSSLAKATGQLAQPIDLGWTWDRPAVAFHVVLAASVDRSAETILRWSSAGADVIRVE